MTFHEFSIHKNLEFFITSGGKHTALKDSLSVFSVFFSATMGKKRTFDSDSDSENEERQVANSDDEETSNRKVSASSSSSNKKSKPLPPGYVCKVCGAKDDHAVYNCPNKIKNFGKVKSSSEKKSSEPSTFEVVKSEPEQSEEAENSAAVEPHSMSVYVSGLPFDIKREKLIEFFVEQGCNPATIDAKRDVRLVMFDDNPNKCKGIAFVKFHDEDQLQKCLEINGTKFGKMSLTIERVVSKSKPPKPSRDVQKREKKGGGTKGCFRCGMLHDPSTCTNPRICYRCKSTEHISSQCPFKKQKA